MNFLRGVLIAIGLLGYSSWAAASAREKCLDALLVAPSWTLLGGDSYRWRPTGLGETLPVQIGGRGYRLRVKSEMENEANIELSASSRPRPRDMLELLTQVHKKFSQRKPGQVHVGSARGKPPEYVARPLIGAGFNTVQIVQRERSFFILLPRGQGMISARFKKTFRGEVLDEEGGRTNKYLTLKAQLKPEDMIERRLKVDIDFGGLEPNAENLQVVAGAWLQRMGYADFHQLKVIGGGWKYSKRVALDLFLNRQRIGFVSFDLKSQDPRWVQLNWHEVKGGAKPSMEIEFEAQGVTPKTREKIKTFLRELRAEVGGEFSTKFLL